ncbi:Pathogenesis-related protein PR-4B, partial [Linum perenne]
VVNATYNHYYDEFEASSSSCAALLNTKPQAQDHKYGSAGFPQDDDDDASVCGLCLKLKNLKSGTEATMRIVHERTIEGLELDKDTFNKLKSN